MATSFQSYNIEKIDRNRQPENDNNFGPRGHLTEYLSTLRRQSWTFDWPPTSYVQYAPSFTALTK